MIRRLGGSTIDIRHCWRAEAAARAAAAPLSSHCSRILKTLECWQQQRKTEQGGLGPKRQCSDCAVRLNQLPQPAALSYGGAAWRLHASSRPPLQKDLCTRCCTRCADRETRSCPKALERSR